MPYITSVFYLQLSLNISQLLLGLSSLAVGMTQLDLHLIQVSFHLLLDSQGIIPAPDLRVKSGLHGVNDPLAVPLDLLHLLILFSQLPVNLTLNLVQLQLDTQNLGFLMLQGSLRYKIKIDKIADTNYLIFYVVLQIESSPQLPQGLTGSQSSLSPPASWISPAHGCSFRSHQFVQSNQKSPLQSNFAFVISLIHILPQPGTLILFNKYSR